MDDVILEDPSKWVSRPKKTSCRILPPRERAAEDGVTQARGQEPTPQSGNQERNNSNSYAVSIVGSSGML
jgi:hypothetical protein